MPADVRHFLVQRALEIARSGEVFTVDEIVGLMRSEGFSDTQLLQLCEEEVYRELRRALR